MHIAFVLVEPGETRNIGAAARAMYTMGYHDLRLVRPQADHLHEHARALAHGSQTVLEAATVYDTLADALHDTEMACATTARHRLRKYHYLSVRDLPQVLAIKGTSLQRLAVVFGSERSGLKAADVDLCDLVTTIPQHQTHPSLNLAQAVMVYSYTLSTAQTAVQIVDQRLNRQQMPAAEYGSLKQLFLQLMNRVGLSDRNQTYVMQGLARLRYEDLYLLHNIRAMVDRKLDSLEPHDGQYQDGQYQDGQQHDR
ncbi:MAG: TrmH family RNA methyltransferase [Cyanobacteria bacterium P01_A01_bin.105]